MYEFDNNKLAEKFKKACAKKAGIKRSDLHIVDWESIDRYAVKAVFSYDPALGNLKRSDLHNYVSKNFGNFQIVDASVKAKKGAVSVVLAQDTTVRPLEDKKQLTPIVAGMYYLDTKISSVWEVKKRANGKKCLVKQDEDNINDIINNRYSRLQSNSMTGHPSKVTASLLTPNFDNLNKGDSVSFILNGEVQKGTIVNFGAGDQIEVKPNDEDRHYTISERSIIDILSKNQGSMDAEQEKLYEYFSNAYGDEEYAKKFFNGNKVTAQSKKKIKASDASNPYSNNSRGVNYQGSMDMTNHRGSYPAQPQSSNPDHVYYSGNPIDPTGQEVNQPNIVMPPPELKPPVEFVEHKPLRLYEDNPYRDEEVPYSYDPDTSLDNQPLYIGDSVVFRGREGVIMEISEYNRKALVDFEEYTNWIDLNALQKAIDVETSEEEVEEDIDEKEIIPEEDKDTGEDEGKDEEGLSLDLIEDEEEEGEEKEEKSEEKEDEGEEEFDFDFGFEEEEESPAEETKKELRRIFGKKKKTEKKPTEKSADKDDGPSLKKWDREVQDPKTGDKTTEKWWALVSDNKDKTGNYKVFKYFTKVDREEENDNKPSEEKVEEHKRKIAYFTMKNA